MSQFICNMLDWYQARIGSHDKQSWEKTLDAQLLRNNLYCVPRKSTRMDDVLIDIDLVKGSTFSKTKSKMSITRILFNGILRLFFYPFYFKWWQHQTTKFFAIVLLVIYLFQMSNFFLYNLYGFKSSFNNKPLITLNEIATPTLIMVILGIMYTYITSAIPNGGKDSATNVSNSTPLANNSASSHVSPTVAEEGPVNDLDKNKTKKKRLARNRSLNGSCSCLASRSRAFKHGPNTKSRPNKADSLSTSALSAGEDGTRRRFRKSLSETTCGTQQKLDQEVLKELLERQENAQEDSTAIIPKLPNKKKLKVDFVPQVKPNDTEDYGEYEDDDDDDDDDDEDDYNEQLDYEDDLAYNMSAVCPHKTGDSQSNLDDLVDEEPTNSSSFSVSNSEQSGYSMDDCVCKYNHYYFNHVNRKHCPNRVKTCARTDNETANGDVEYADTTNGMTKLDSMQLDKLNNNVSALPEGKLLQKQISIESDSAIPTSLATPISSMSNLSTPNSDSKAAEKAPEQTETPTILKASSLSAQKLECDCKECCTVRQAAKNYQRRRANSSKVARDNSSALPVSASIQASNVVSNQNAGHSSCPNIKKINCLVWESNEWKGADMTVLEISNCIISNVKDVSFKLDYFYVGLIFSLMLSSMPLYFYHKAGTASLSLSGLTASPILSFNSVRIDEPNKTTQILTAQEKASALMDSSSLLVNLLGEFPVSCLFNSLGLVLTIEAGAAYIILNTLFSTIVLCVLFFSLLTIAERTLNQRFLHAKYFCSLTSNRKARKHNLPHFRLNKVEHIRTWLSVRSYMRRKGPQRSIDAIISSTFLIGVGLLSIVCIRFLQDADFLSDSLLNWQLVIWCLCIWTFMLRFMTIGFQINKKYRNCMSTVITEQINLYLQMEKMPEKKDELTVVNNVLKLASDLLKEVEGPFKISGLGVDPWVYNVTKVVILSAFSAVLSELFGFKLKLYKIKIN